MSRREHQPDYDDEFTTRIGQFSVHVRPVNMFTYYMHAPNAKIIRKGDIDVPLHQIRMTFGAGPCIAGLVVLQDTPHLFHYDPTMFRHELPLLANADSGLIGGGVRSFLRSQDRINLAQFGVIGQGVISVLINHVDRRKLKLLYISS